MTRALRSVSSEKGRDPRDFALIAYGGAGPVHAAGLAEELGCPTVLVPALAGLFSSLGLLFARPEFHDVLSCHLDARARRPGRDRRDPRARCRHGSRPSLAGAEAEWVRSAELRYGGQTLGGRGRARRRRRRRGVLAALIDRFEDEHERLYGVRGEAGSPIEIRALRVAGLGPSSAVERLVLGRPDAARRTASARRRSTARRHERPRPQPRIDRRAPGARSAARRRVRHDGDRPPRLDRPPRPGDRDADPGAAMSAGSGSRPRDPGRSSATRSPRSPTRWRRRSSAPPTPTVVRDGMDFSAALCDASGRRSPRR